MEGNRCGCEGSESLGFGAFVILDVQWVLIAVQATPATFKVQATHTQISPVIAHTSPREPPASESTLKDDGYRTPKELIAAIKAAKTKTSFPSTNAMDIDSRLPPNNPPFIPPNPQLPNTSITVSVPPISTAPITSTNPSSSGSPLMANKGAPKKRPPLPMKRPAPTANLFIPKKVRGRSLYPISSTDYCVSANSPLRNLCSRSQASSTQSAPIIFIAIMFYALHYIFTPHWT
jgi:hypothetical protein